MPRCNADGTKQCNILISFEGFEKLAIQQVSGPIQKKSSMSDDSSSDMMELDENALVTDPHLESNLRRLQEEEQLLLEQQTAMEAQNVDDIAALEHQDALRLNQLQQQELQRQQQQQAARIARYHQLVAQEHGAHSLAGVAGGASPSPAPAPPARERVARRRATCTVRVNNLHAAEAIETDV